jgi:hypothetical protein
MVEASTCRDGADSWVGAARRPGRRSAPTWRVIAEPGAPVAPAPVEPVPVPEPGPRARLGFDETDLARACAAVAATVRAAESEAAAERAERRIADALEAIAGSLDSADAVLAESRRQFREAAAHLAAAATEALALGPGAKVAARLADALAADCLARFDPALALTVEVAADIADALAARLATSPVVQARPGRVAVEAVADMGPGEARLVWQDGAADWSVERLHADAAALIRRLAEPTRPSASNASSSNESEQA